MDKSCTKSKTLGAISTGEASSKVSKGGKDGSTLNHGTDTAQTLSSHSKHETLSEHQESTVAVTDLPVPGLVLDYQPSGQKPPRVIPYRLSKQAETSTTTRTHVAPEQTEDSVEDGSVANESLHYANLDLSRGSARIANPEEDTTYADIGN